MYLIMDLPFSLIAILHSKYIHMYLEINYLIQQAKLSIISLVNIVYGFLIISVSTTLNVQQQDYSLIYTLVCMYVVV